MKNALGIDPGRDKIGFAFVDIFSGELLISGIFQKNDIDKFFHNIKNKKNLNQWVIENKIENKINFSNEKLISDLKVIFIGNGTTAKDLIEYIKNFFSFFSIEIFIIDEKNTTIEARNLYWKIHKPDFLQRFLPEKMRFPKRIIDDIAAWSIALRGIKIYRDIIKDKL